MIEFGEVGLHGHEMFDLVGNQRRELARELGLLPLGEVLYLRGHLKEVVSALMEAGYRALASVIETTIPEADKRPGEKSWHSTVEEPVVYIGDEAQGHEALRRVKLWCGSSADLPHSYAFVDLLEQKAKSGNTRERISAFSKYWTLTQVRPPREFEQWSREVSDLLSPHLARYGLHADHPLARESVAWILHSDPRVAASRAADYALREVLRYELNRLLGYEGNYLAIPDDVTSLAEGLDRCRDLTRAERNFLLLNLRLEEWKGGQTRFHSIREGLTERCKLESFLMGVLDTSRLRSYSTFSIAPFYDNVEYQASLQFGIIFEDSFCLKGLDNNGESVLEFEGRSFRVSLGGNVGQRLLDGKPLLPGQVKAIEEVLSNKVAP